MKTLLRFNSTKNHRSSLFSLKETYWNLSSAARDILMIFYVYNNAAVTIIAETETASIAFITIINHLTVLFNK